MVVTVYDGAGDLPVWRHAFVPPAMPWPTNRALAPNMKAMCVTDARVSRGHFDERCALNGKKQVRSLPK
jgi:hypothetical protein